MTVGTAQRPPGVLIADDEEAICFSLARALRRREVTPFVAPDGAAALGLFRASGGLIDLAVLDVRMPGLSGPETLLALRRLRPNLGCCFLTAYGAEGVRLTGGEVVLEKPFDLDEFLEVVERLLEEGPQRFPMPRLRVY